MKSVMRFWLELGIDGFRADAVPYLIEREGTNCENLPETHHYLKELRALIDKEYPGRILLAEANQWPRDLRPYFADGDEFHMAFRFPLMPRLFMAIAKGDATVISENLEQSPEIPSGCQWCTFLRNHDELTVEMVTEEERRFLWQYYAPEPRMRLNLGIRRRLAPLLNGDINKIELLYAVMLSLPGAPIIYYGDEIGMGDNIWLNDRDGVRTPMQWTSAKNGGFSERAPDGLVLPVIDQGQYSYRNINVEAQIDDTGSLFNRLRALIEVRKIHPAFSSQEFKILFRDRPAIFAVERFEPGKSIICIHNLSSEAQQIDLQRPQCTLLHGSRNGTASRYEFTDTNILLEPYAYVWLENCALHNSD